MDLQLSLKADRRQRSDRPGTPRGGRRVTDPGGLAPAGPLSPSDAARLQHHLAPSPASTSAFPDEDD
jgi:hypothetical protein